MKIITNPTPPEPRKRARHKPTEAEVVAMKCRDDPGTGITTYKKTKTPAHALRKRLIEQGVEAKVEKVANPSRDHVYAVHATFNEPARVEAQQEFLAPVIDFESYRRNR